MDGAGQQKARRERGAGTLVERAPGVWRLRVYAGRDPVTGRPRQVSKTVRARNRTVALRELRAFAAEVEADQGTPENHTVKELLHRWVEEFLPGEGKAKTTVSSYRLIVTKHLIPAFGHLPLKELTAYDLDRYYRARQAAGMADRTVRQHHAILASALSQAVRWSWLARSPAPLARPPKPPRGQGFIPTVEQVRALIAAADTAGNDELAMAIILAAITGCRRGEICGLRWSDLNADTGTLLVERQRVPLPGGDQTVPLKHGDGRQVAVDALVLAALERYRRKVDARCAALRADRVEDGWLISSDGGRTAMSPKWLSEAIHALGTKTKVPVTPHALRRFAATRLVGGLADVRTAAGRLGHSPEVMLRRYAGFIPTKDQEAARGLEVLVLGEAPE